MRTHLPRVQVLLFSLAISLAASSCVRSSSTDSIPAEEFTLVSSSLATGAIWHINRPIQFRFSESLDIASIDSTSVKIIATDGSPAVGAFALHGTDTDGDGFNDVLDDRILVFTPTCPREADLSDAGLKPGGVGYTLTLFGADALGKNAVRSRKGKRLSKTVTIPFGTPSSIDRSVVLFDPLPGAPFPILRPEGSKLVLATRFELGGGRDPVYIEFDELEQTLSVPPGFVLPRNLFADPSTTVGLSLVFSEPVGSASENLARIRWEYDASPGGSPAGSNGPFFVPLDTRVELSQNCIDATVVSVVPNGPLPSGRRVRVVIAPGFEDASGHALPIGIEQFPDVFTENTRYQSLAQSELAGDEVREDFDFGGAVSLEDTTLEGSVADWGDGRLQARFDRACNGGPGGHFDWIIQSGQTVVLDTTQALIVGGPGGVPTQQQTVLGGRVEVRDLIVEEGGELRAMGPHPLRICASGNVIVRGIINVSGFNAKDVATLNTGNQPETGGAGGPGGGAGGFSSENTSGSTAEGGTGFDPAGNASGGTGGETGFAARNLGKDARRPGGGGGGRFAADEGTFLAQPGKPGAAQSKGALSGLSPAAGGRPGVGPFVDGDPTNDFFGLAAVTDLDGNLVTTIQGELTGLWGGYGGGGGGEASPTAVFPTNNWNVGFDEKGGPGGGGGGALEIRALGRVVLGENGLIKSNGGWGGTGENTLFLDHVGGTGGSGSGGHIVIESPNQIDFTDGDPSAATTRIRIRARGAAGRIGPTMNVPQGISHGGAGGPGVVQLHVPLRGQRPSSEPGAALLVPEAVSGSSNPLAQLVEPSPKVLLPSFDTRSIARSRWIPTAGAGVRANGTRGPIEFLPDVTRAGFGESLIGPLALGSPDVRVGDDGSTLHLSGDALASLRAAGEWNDVYLRTPALLQGSELRLSAAVPGSEPLVRIVAAAHYDDARLQLSLSVAHGEESLAESIATLGEDATLVVATRRAEGVESSEAVRILYQAARDDGFGAADDANPLVDWTEDVSAFNALRPGELAWFRFRVEFERSTSALGTGGDPLPMALDRLRIPFRF